MLFAGLYDSATLDGACAFAERQARLIAGLLIGQSEPLWTFTIVTTAASSDYSWLHDRQPVILTSQDALDRWLDTSTQNWDPKLSRLLDPYTDSDSPLEWCVVGSHPLRGTSLTPRNSYAVPQEVGRVGVESPTFIEPVEKRKDGIEALFSRQVAKGTSPSRGKRKRESSPPIDEKPSRSVKTEPVDVDASDSDVEILPDHPPVRSRLLPSLPHSFPHTHPQTDPPSQSKKGKSNSSPKVAAGTFLPSSPYSLTALSFPLKVSSHSNDDDGPEEKAQSSFLFHSTGATAHYRNCLAYHAVLAPQETGEIRARQIDSQNHIFLCQNLKAPCCLSLYVDLPLLVCIVSATRTLALLLPHT